jgi:oxygen-independent coproporphyrinogen-3 oxidase
MGGGNPGILTPIYIERIAENIHKKLNKQPEEWTVELSPNIISKDKLHAWKSVGVNRLSLGIQSFDERMLSVLGRKQTAQQIFRAYEWIRAIGFQNVGFDLIFSIPNQTIAQVVVDLSTAIELAPEHISTYCLTYEDGTPLTHRIGDASEEGRDHDFYEIVCQFLGSHGYEQYEISNFCKAGYYSRHNRNTWLMGEWIGVGPSASSQYCGKRYTNIASLGSWADGIGREDPVYTDVVELDGEMLATDKIIFGLRMNEGIDMGDHPEAEQLASFFYYLQNELLLIQEGSRIRLTEKGRLVCDAIAKEIFNILQ